MDGKKGLCEFRNKVKLVMIKSILPKVKYREKIAVLGEYSFSKICLLLAIK